MSGERKLTREQFAQVLERRRAKAEAERERLRFISFDLETARCLPRSANPAEHMPLGITVAACWISSNERRYWYGASAGNPAPFMKRDECARLVHDLQEIAAGGTRLVTWNGAGFDLRVLAQESGLWNECAALAATHCDLMFQFLCSEGHYLSLEAVASPLGMKKRGLSGSDAPSAWRARRFSGVAEYLIGDVEMLAVAFTRMRTDGGLCWTTRGGRVRQWCAPRPLSVREAFQLPLPNTAWMNEPPRREDSVGWIQAVARGGDEARRLADLPPYEAQHSMTIAKVTGRLLGLLNP